MSEAKDLVLETLLAVKADVAPALDESLLKSCYTIQKKHQFDQDRSVSTQSIDRLIEEKTQELAADKKG